jgi:hypothetical protein
LHLSLLPKKKGALPSIVAILSGRLKETGIVWRKFKSKCIVSLRSSKLDRDNNNDGDKDGTWDELAETTFNMYFKSARDEECDNENEYDRHEDNEAFNESLSSLVRETTRNCSAVVQVPRLGKWS